MKTDQNSAGVRFPPPFVYLGFLLIGVALDRRLVGLDLPMDFPVRLAVGAAPFLAGIVIGVGAMRLFGRAGTPVEPWRTPQAFVADGVYRWTRNPMYLGMALVYIGIAIAAGSGTALLLLPIVIAVIHTQVIAREERCLEQRFGATYLEYKRRVRRWM